MKYIIEIEDEPLVRKSALHGETAVYRAKGFRSLVFDEAGLKKLKPLDDERASMCIGDEIRRKPKNKTGIAGERGIILENIVSDQCTVCAVWWADGSVSFIPSDYIEKTGIHYTHFAEAPSYLRRG